MYNVQSIDELYCRLYLSLLHQRICFERDRNYCQYSILNILCGLSIRPAVNYLDRQIRAITFLNLQARRNINHLFASCLTLFQCNHGADFAHHVWISQPNFQPFCPACRDGCLNLLPGETISCWFWGNWSITPMLKVS